MKCPSCKKRLREISDGWVVCFNSSCIIADEPFENMEKMNIFVKQNNNIQNGGKQW